MCTHAPPDAFSAMSARVQARSQNGLMATMMTSSAASTALRFDATLRCRKMRQFPSQSGKRFRWIEQTQFRPNAIRRGRANEGLRRLKSEIIDGRDTQKSALMGLT